MSPDSSLYTLAPTIPRSVAGWDGTRLGRENCAHVALQGPTPCCSHAAPNPMLLPILHNGDSEEMTPAHRTTWCTDHLQRRCLEKL